MHNPFVESRFLRFTAWSLMMLAAFLAAVFSAPKFASFVPAFFLPLMVPMVLMRLKSSRRS
jgi:hypothetical protein